MRIPKKSSFAELRSFLKLSLRESGSEKVSNWNHLNEGNWNHELWGGILPNHQWIDDVTPHHPVWICRLDGHMCLANSLAMKLANVTVNTREVPGGTILRDASGVPTGVFKDKAMDIVKAAIPKPTPAEEDAALEAAMRYVNSFGVTSLHHMSWEWNDLVVFQRNHRHERLTTRVYVVSPWHEWKHLAEYVSEHGKGDAWVQWGSVKGFTDGSLGSRTALVSEPYLDDPGTGLEVTPESEIWEGLEGAARNQLGVSLHAIGDLATHRLLQLFRRAEPLAPSSDRRWRMEHAQTLRSTDLPLMAQLGIIASVQPLHLSDDGDWAERALGNRTKDLFPLRSMLDAGIRLAGGSDWFVAPPIPLEGIWAAVTRTTFGNKTFHPEHRISVEEALTAYTSSAAFAQFAEKRVGQIRPGYLADLVLLEQDLFEIPPEEIPNVRVVSTLVNGKVVYSSLEH